MASRVQPLGHLFPVHRREFHILRNHREKWRKNNAGSVGLPCFVLPPIHHHPRLPYLSLSSRSHFYSSALPPRTMFRRRPPPSPASLSSMTITNSSDPNAHADRGSGPQSAAIKTVRAVMKGRVQGVFYRDWTVENARQLELKGWVRNRRDGSVEALFSGNPDSVHEMEQRCRRGPPAAVVTGFEVYPSREDPGTGFECKQTA